MTIKEEMHMPPGISVGQKRQTEFIAEALASEGIDVVFTVPDEVTVILADSLFERGIRVLRARHEQGAVLMADGYSRATGKVGVCLIGHGPGLAQTGTALVTARKKGSAVLVLIGRIPGAPNELGGIKHFDESQYVAATGNEYLSVRSSESLVEDFHSAFRKVRLHKGPVVLQLPTLGSLLADMSEYSKYVPEMPTLKGSEGVDPSLPGIEAAAAMLINARRPVIFAGRGALDARSEIIKLADRFGALLCTSLQARELFRGHSRNIGILGTYANEPVAELLTACDGFLALGASLNPNQTGGRAIAANARTFQVDADASRLGALSPIEQGIVGDVGMVVGAINAALDGAQIVPTEGGWANDNFRTLIKAASVFPAPAKPRSHSSESPARMSASAFLRALDDLLPANRFVIVDGGYFMNFVVDQITITDPSSWIWSLDFASIGLGLSLGIGATVGRDDKRCVVFVGDGGLAMSLQELETIVRERIPLLVIVMNDGTYMSEVSVLQGAEFPTRMAEMGAIDFSKIATAFGATATTVTALSDLDTLPELLRDTKVPILIDARVDENEDHRRRRAG